MRFLTYGLLFLSAGFLAICGCQYPQDITDLNVPENPMLCQQGSTYPIWAGQSMLAGNLIVHNDENHLYITYMLFEDWQLLETHVHVAADLSGIPTNRAGIPVPGQFDYSCEHDPPVSSYTWVIDLAGYPFQCGDEIVIAAHASVEHWLEPSGTYEQETAWGGENPGPGPRWWFYALYTLTCGGGGGGPVYGDETAWARMYDDPLDFTWELPGANWATYLRTVPCFEPETFFFYAGQHYGVGEVKIWKDMDWLYVEADLYSGFELEEAHLNVQLEEGLLGAAPGQYPWKEEFYPFVEDHTFQIPWDPAWTDAELCIALHGVVWGEYPED